MFCLCAIQEQVVGGIKLSLKNWNFKILSYIRPTINVL